MIKQTVTQLVEKHRSSNPYEIASQNNVLVLFEELGDMLGYFNTYNRIKMIHINNHVDEQLQRFTCAHELGHSVLHPGVNTPFLRKNTLTSIDRIEREANQFAVEMLLPDQLLLDGMTLYEAAQICGVPKEVACLKRTPKRSY
ncbi:ImmA/IrrE family metallo-endopeptidase [Paenibacillus motobuensis]|uniref:ImmA/IrrE family metallo-endopeptidase n=1 Tax=Paenibacillus TaxID=44249 RepID=UPI00203B241B|nr:MULTISPECIES: ImmA/IrrE family metallo-endopeptidase [Paenibacillus]MCM3041680.1 ImmA/IrrE family metallo-endopeptidase [Paenibacillus lutimineralis]MCM3648784.1 ImmA/IrrE family metallo-endopeptidase [Paenibacillus motobuensis]